MKIYLGADHRGFKLKQQIKVYLEEKGYDVIDKGAFEYNEDDDYPDFAFAVAQDVAKEKRSKGILLCGSSIGVTVCANKVAGIIGSQVRTPKEAKEDIEHHNSNVLALSSDNLDIDTVKKILDSWLSAKFEGGRHRRRIQKIKHYEQTAYKMYENIIRTDKGLIIILLFSIFAFLVALLVNSIVRRPPELRNRPAPIFEIASEDSYQFTCRDRNGQCFGPQTTGAGYIFCDLNGNPQGASDCGSGGPNIPFCTREGGGVHCDGKNIVRCDGKGAKEYVVEECNKGCDGSTDKCIGGGTAVNNNNLSFCAKKGAGNHCNGKNIVRCDTKNSTEYILEQCNNGCDVASDKCIGGGTITSQNTFCSKEGVGSHCNGTNIMRCDTKDSTEYILEQCNKGCDVSTDKCIGGGTITSQNTFCSKEGVGSHCDGTNIVRCDSKDTREYLLERCNNGCDSALDKCIGGGTLVSNSQTQLNNTYTINGCGYPSTYSFVDLNRDNKANLSDFVCFVEEYRRRN